MKSDFGVQDAKKVAFELTGRKRKEQKFAPWQGRAKGEQGVDQLNRLLAGEAKDQSQVEAVL